MSRHTSTDRPAEGTPGAPPSAVTDPAAGHAVVDHRTLPRRRGDVLVDAILDAALTELEETGYAGLTMDRVAARARTSKTSLYRRWPNRAELALAALRHRSRAVAPGEVAGGLRAGLLGVLRRLAGTFDGPVGDIVRGLVSDPDLLGALHNQLPANPFHAVLAVMDAAVNRGEIPAAAVTRRVAEAGPTLLAHHFLRHSAPIPDEVITGIVDEIILPALHRQLP